MRRLVLALLTVALLVPPAVACVGKTLVIGALETPRGRLVAQILAILVNERTGTTVKIAEFADEEGLHRALARGELDLTVEYTRRALGRLNMNAPGDPEAAYRNVKAAYQEKLNLVWLPALGFQDPDGGGLAAPVARKDTLKKFPALPRLIAKTEGVLPEPTVSSLAASADPAKTARSFLREQKLI